MKQSYSSFAAAVLKKEHGTVFRQGDFSAAVGYPAPYRVGASSLGAQFVYKTLNRVDNLACGRFFLNDDGTADRPPIVLESNRPISDMHAIAFSISCEQDLLGITRLLRAAGIEPLAVDRQEKDPTVIIGGPLTMVDPRLTAPLADIVTVGYTDHILPLLGELLVSHRGDKATLLQQAADLAPAVYTPALNKEPPPETLEMPPPALPAAAALWSEGAELKNLFLVEAVRGCKRSCAFCTMSRAAVRAPSFHAFDAADILSSIPPDAPGVGLVGAAVTDHPEIEYLTQTLLKAGKRVSLSSIRADKLTENLAHLLRQSGLRTLTVAADGSSERVRRSVKKGITAAHLIKAAAIARQTGFSGLKIYSMVGLPGETDDDIAELSELLLTCAAKIKVSATVQAFVPKPGTPLCRAPMEALPVIERRLRLLKKGVKGRVRLLPTSPKWSVIDWKLAHGGFQSAHAAIAAENEGASYAAWKKAVRSIIS